MESKILRKYIFKFYLNANHYIIIDGKEGQIHPHTWEFVISIIRDSSDFVQFDEFEKAIDEYFDRYQNCVLNETEPFNTITPTLENMSDYFIYDIRDIITKLGGELVQMESSETPTRSYVISLEKDQRFIKNLEKKTGENMDKIIDSVIDGIVD